LRQSEVRRERNEKRKRNLSWTVKDYTRTVESGNSGEAEKLLPKVYKTIDKMAKVNIIKKGKADRMKSRLTKKLSASKKEAK